MPVSDLYSWGQVAEASSCWLPLVVSDGQLGQQRPGLIRGASPLLLVTWASLLVVVEFYHGRDMHLHHHD